MDRDSEIKLKKKKTSRKKEFDSTNSREQCTVSDTLQ